MTTDRDDEIKDTTEGLLPCPFCGGEVEDVGVGAIWHPNRFRGDTPCPIEHIGIAIDKWNRRADNGLIKCSEQMPKQTAKQQYDACNGNSEHDPVERLRVFCSLAMNEQDWLDAEPFFDAITTRLQTGEQMQEPVATKHPTLDECFAADKLPESVKVPVNGDARGHLQELVTAMHNTFISSWQTTAGWQKQLDAAAEYLAATEGVSDDQA